MEHVASQQGLPRWRHWNRLVHDRGGRSARGGVRPQGCRGLDDLGLVPLGLFGVYAGGYVRLSRVGYLITVGPGTGGYSVVGVVDNGAPMDVRFDRLRVDAVSVASGRTSTVHGFWTDANGAANKVTYTNCVVVGWTGTGGTHHGFTKVSGTTGNVRIYNGTAHGCAIGFASDGNGMLVKNCGAVNCANGFNGTFDAASTNDASSLARTPPERIHGTASRPRS